VSKKTRTLEIDEDLAFQRKEWFAQRVGIAALSLFVVAALLGLTGAGGVLSHATAGEPGRALSVEYERFVRRGAMSTMTLRIHSDPPGFIQFWVSAPYLARVRVDSVAPMPQTVTLEQARHVYTIRAASADVAVTIEMEHMAWGKLEGEVGIVGGPSERFSQISLF
jgi:hypothetical protein